MPTSPSPRSEQLGAPNPPAIRFTRGTSFGASRFTHLLRPAKLLALLYGSDRYARPSRAFTSRLPTDRLPSPLLDMTTTATGLLCWRDFHPLEWQLASLHQIRTCGFPAYGSHLGYQRQAAVCVPAPVTRLAGAESSACFAGPHSPWSPPFAPPSPPRLTPPRMLRSGRRFVRRLHSYYGGARLLVPVHHRLRLLAFPMRTVPLTDTDGQTRDSQLPMRSFCA